MSREEAKAALAASAKDDDGSDSDDEDYVPPAESDDEGPGTAGVVTDDAGAAPILSSAKQKAVDDAFASLFGSSSEGAAASTRSSSKKKSKKKLAASKKALKKKKRVLADIFGGAEASKLLSTARAATALGRPKVSNKAVPRLEKKVVTEVKKFAGQEVTIKRTVVAPVGDASSSKAAAAASKSKATEANSSVRKLPPTGAAAAPGIDAVLAEMNGPSKISTVAKTSADWDLFKDKTGMEDELEKKAQGKDAYLVKKDFLNRVDVRKFEQEKAERDRKRAARGV